MFVTQVYKSVMYVTVCAACAALMAAGPILQAVGVIGG